MTWQVEDIFGSLSLSLSLSDVTFQISDVLKKNRPVLIHWTQLLHLSSASRVGGQAARKRMVGSHLSLAGSDPSLLLRTVWQEGVLGPRLDAGGWECRFTVHTQIRNKLVTSPAGSLFGIGNRSFLLTFSKPIFGKQNWKEKDCNFSFTSLTLCSRNDVEKRKSWKRLEPNQGT